MDREVLHALRNCLHIIALISESPIPSSPEVAVVRTSRIQVQINYASMLIDRLEADEREAGK